jgi:hypothetical protein
MARPGAEPDAADACAAIAVAVAAVAPAGWRPWADSRGAPGFAP